MGQTRQEVKRPKMCFFLDFSLVSRHDITYFQAQNGFYPKNTLKAQIQNIRQGRCTWRTWLKHPPKLGNFSKKDFLTMFDAHSWIIFLFIILVNIFEYS